MIFINNYNSQNLTSKFGVNQFADLTRPEFKRLMSPAKLKSKFTNNHNKSVNETHFLGSTHARKLPKSVDWHRAGKMSRVKDQLYCGGCWAFAVADAIESRFAITKNTPVVELSIQELLDCDHDGVNDGCIGGNLPEGYDYVIDMKGLCTANEYGFIGKDQKHCKASKCKHRSGRIVDYGIVIPNSEKALQRAVAQGPVAIAIEADADAMQFYESGVLNTGDCGVNVDHAVVMVGYGVTSKGLKYWKIKNSWSSEWGEGGYMRLCRECGKNGRTGECGITVESVFPII